MHKKAKQPAGHAESVARRSFIKKTALGAVFAVPAIESLTKSDVLMKSALASTAAWTITAQVYPNDATGGTVAPASQMVPSGGSATVTVTPKAGFTWYGYTLDGSGLIGTTLAQQSTGVYTFTSVNANHSLVIYFDGTF